MNLDSHLRWLCFLLLLGSSHWAAALTVVEGPAVQVTDTTAVISWKTDVEAGSRVQYGLSPQALSQRATGAVGTAHRIELRGLARGTVYHFTIGSARRMLQSGMFQTAGTGAKTETSKPSGGLISSVVAGLFSSSSASGTKASANQGSETGRLKPAAVSRPSAAPPARETWRHMDSLADHYQRHGSDFDCKSEEQYAALAWQFLQHARKQSLPLKWDTSDGTLRVWEPATRTFAAYDRRGKTRTFFKPTSPDYWNRQPGKLITPDELPF